MPKTMVDNPDRLAELAGWLETHDAHAEYHLQLLDEVAQVASGELCGDIELRRALADKLERWRYQWLKELSGQISREDRQLIDELDVLANRLAGRPGRPARQPRQALSNVASDGGRNSSAEGVDEATITSLLDASFPLDQLARRARQQTAQWFAAPATEAAVAPAADPRPSRPAAGTAGHPRRMVLYAPLYLSSYCVNHCTYCGFRYPQDIQREHLTVDEALCQAEILAARGFRHLLLVAGDFPRLTSTGYIAQILSALRDRGLSVGVEIASQSTSQYAQLVEAGACGVTLYQETYDEALYARYHPRGTKASFDWRLEGPQRAAEAGISRLGLGILLGLADARREIVLLIRHGRYLQTLFPAARFSFALPRIHQAPGEFTLRYPVDDQLFVRLYCVLRLAFPAAHLVLSTRESESLRNRLARICISQMSAGSSTVPGGYQSPHADQPDRQQFPVTDHRSAAAMSKWLADNGFQVRWDLEPIA